MPKLRKDAKAVVHVSSTMLRANWFGSELKNCIVVRPGGERRDTEGYIVRQVRFDGPTQMVFGAQPRKASREGIAAETSAGHVGTLPGFDNAIMVYLEADEKDIHVQLNDGDEYIPLNRFKDDAKGLKARVINPLKEINC